MIKIDFSGKGNQNLEIGKKDIVNVNETEAVSGAPAAAEAPQDGPALPMVSIPMIHEVWQQRAPVQIDLQKH